MMANGHDGGDEKVALQRQLEALQQRISELETDQNLPAPRLSDAEVAPLSEADVTLRRLVQRISMILQAEKIVIMFYQSELGELVGIPPALAWMTSD